MLSVLVFLLVLGACLLLGPQRSPALASPLVMSSWCRVRPLSALLVPGASPGVELGPPPHPPCSLWGISWCFSWCWMTHRAGACPGARQLSCPVVPCCRPGAAVLVPSQAIFLVPSWSPSAPVPQCPSAPVQLYPGNLLVTWNVPSCLL